ncbi:DoxX family protein [Candidatus Sumerlaeota bacterium]|nr:DoxX family protein [Candidatus Sumerlaeota bacterium]
MKTLKKILFVSSDERNIGYLLLRLFVGVAFITHGYPKMFGGVERWEGIGKAMSRLGIDLFPVFWGFMASFAEFFGGFFLILGLCTTIFSFLIFFTMFVAAFFVHAADPFAKKEIALVFFFCAFLFMVKGAGKYSLDYPLFK